MFGFAASLLLHAGLLLALDPGSEFFARGRAPGKSTDARLIANLVSPQRADNPDAVAAIMDTESAASATASPETTDIEPVNPGRKNTLPDTGIQDATGDQVAYYSSKELDVRPVPIGEIIPFTPDLTASVSGRVLLRIQINREGTVDRVIVVRSVPDHSFGPGTFWPFERAKFTPALRRGVVVNSEILIELRFGPDRDGEATPQTLQAPPPQTTSQTPQGTVPGR